MVAIGASSQTKGRGTSGRAWVGLSGNVFLTVAIKRDAVPYIPTLLPLRIGTIIARGRRQCGMTYMYICVYLCGGRYGEEMGWSRLMRGLTGEGHGRVWWCVGNGRGDRPPAPHCPQSDPQVAQRRAHRRRQGTQGHTKVEEARSCEGREGSIMLIDVMWCDGVAGEWPADRVGGRPLPARHWRQPGTGTHTQETHLERKWGYDHFIQRGAPVRWLGPFFVVVVA